jgi:hypothetical protein
VAVELEKLRAVFGYDMEAWHTAAGLYIEALSDLPYDLLRDAVAVCIRTAGPGDHFPKPGAIRATVNDVLGARRARLKRAQVPRDEDEWPDWLRTIWGPLPQGRRERNEAIACEAQKRIDSSKRLLEVSNLMSKHGYSIDQAWKVWAGGMVPPSQASLDDGFKQIARALGAKATEQRKPKHEDLEELRRGRVELGLEGGEDVS